MKVFANAVLLTLLGSGCGDNLAEPPTDTDEPSDDQTIVTIETRVPPALVAFRLESSATWNSLDVTGRITFEATVNGPYRVVVVCNQPSASEFFDTFATEHARTPADPHVIENPCGADSFVARGTMTEPGLVALGGASTGDVSGAWQFELPASVGTFDLVMMFGDLLEAGVDRIAIRRDIAVTGNLDLGSLQAEQEHAQAMPELSFTSSNLEAGERLSHRLTLRARNTSVLVGSPLLGNIDWRLAVAPQSILAPGDQQVVTLTATRPANPAGNTYYRVTAVEVKDNTPTAVLLPEHLAPVTFDTTPDRLSATWQSLPDPSELWLTRRSLKKHVIDLGDGNLSIGLSELRHRFVTSAAFLAAAGATSAVLDLHEIPGFDPEWQHDPNEYCNYELDLVHQNSNMRSGIAGLVAPPRP